MEYSVFDLIHILLRKWYVILISMCVLGGLSVITAHRSYTQAVQNYEDSISETVSAGVDTGTLTATYLYDYQLTDLTKYLAEARRRAAFYKRFAEELGAGIEAGGLDLTSLAGTAYASASQDAVSLVTNDRVLAKTQTDMDAFNAGPLQITNHLTVESLPGNVIRITISGLEEQPALNLLDAYLNSVESVGISDYSIKVVLSEREKEFTLDPLRLSQSAQFAQVVMKKPDMAPTLVKTVGTAAAFAFVFSCFMILVVTFVKDSRRTEGVERES